MFKKYFFSAFSYSLFLNFNQLNLQAQEPAREVPKLLQESDISVQLDAANTAANTAVQSSSFLEVIFLLILIALAIYLVVRFLKRLTLLAAQKGELLQLLGVEQLPGGLLFHLVALDKKIYLFAGQQGKMQLIDTFSDSEECDRLRLIASQQKKISKPFSQILIRRR